MEPDEYALLKMRPLEAKRFEQAMISLEEEYLGDKLPLSGMPGDTWNGSTMTKTGNGVSPVKVQPKQDKSGTGIRKDMSPSNARSSGTLPKEYKTQQRTY